LGAGEPDGFSVAQEALEKYPGTVVIMQSGDFRADSGLDSMIMKTEINCACIYKKFLKLKRDRKNNILEIFLSDGILEVGDARR